MSFSAVNENEIPFTAENEMKTNMDIHFRPKNEKESLLIILVFFSYISSPSRPYNAPPIPRRVSVSPFYPVVLVDGIPLSSCITLYRYLCGIFLDDISTRKQFAFLVYCYRVKAKNCFCSVTNCHGVACSLPTRITTKVLKNCKTFS